MHPQSLVHPTRQVKFHRVAPVTPSHLHTAAAAAAGLQASTEELVAQVDKDLRTMLLKPEAPLPRVVGVRVWPRAIPQFNVGHLDTLDEAKQVRGTADER
jgi:protoporphyrinogen oxidase